MRILTLLSLLLIASPALAETFADVADISVRFEPATAKPGDKVKLLVTITPKPDCFTYPVNPPEDQAARNKFRLPTVDFLTFTSTVVDPSGWKEKPAVEPGKVDRYYPQEVTWEVAAIVNANATPGPRTVPLTGSAFQACNQTNCFYTDRRNPPRRRSKSNQAPPQRRHQQWHQYRHQYRHQRHSPRQLRHQWQRPLPHTVAAAWCEKLTCRSRSTLRNSTTFVSKLDGENAIPTTSIFGFLLTAAIWGWISLVTPCVFPMIPITVSLFLKQGNKSTGEVLKLASVYSLTIILVIGLSAVALLSVFRRLSVDPYMNLFLGGLLIAFALSLFGMFDIALPGFMLRAAEKRRAGGGLLGTVFGALAFSIVSFTCVAPFLGGFAGMAASGQFSQVQLLAGGLAFATAFASPFFLLALFPSLLKKMPKSGGWLDTIKAVMGFLELAAALKFFRTAELRLLPRTEYFTYDLSLAGMIVVAAVCGLYLLNLFRLPHDEEKPKHSAWGD